LQRSLRFFASHNIISKVSGTYDEGNVSFYILPSIAYALDNEKIVAMSQALDELNNPNNSLTNTELGHVAKQITLKEILMKTLTKIRIINWHYFWNETIEVKPIVFLTGVNGSGKSTLIDALEVVLLGDTTGRSFNKAAMDKSSRTLRGYLKGEIGDDQDNGFKYLRNGRFTSYIVLEFYDDMNKENFLMGIVFDSFEDGSEEHHFFVLNDKIPENGFVENKVPLDYKQLNDFFNAKTIVVTLNSLIAIDNIKNI
jgi:uncharacterized protein YPO0396